MIFTSYSSTKQLANLSQPVHLAIGIFDGVHLGHQSVLDACRRGAQGEDGICGVLTFSPHPSRLFAPDHPTLLLQDKETQNKLFERQGLNFSIIQEFSKEFAAISSEDFLLKIKKDIPTLSGVYVGENFRFGKGRFGDVSTLIEEGKKIGVTVISADRIRYNGQPISSTRIRKELENGEIEEVNKLLGYEYFSTGIVLQGKQLGRTINFPTVNLAWNSELRPAYGVYQVKASFRNKENVLGVANYGLRPTVEKNASSPLLEIHFNEDPFLSPGDAISVRWQKFIRPEKTFASVEELKEQIAQDVHDVLGEK